MKHLYHIPTAIVLLLLIIISAESCSSQKNTAITRWRQSFNTRYNVYYNGAQAYITGSLEKENGNQDNFTDILPLYTVSNKNSISLGKSNFDIAIQKCEKAIQLHSIKKRPEWNNKKKDLKDKEWLNRKEYNPFLWKVWMLMGRSQFYEGSFEDAASTFSYMSRLYKTQPAIYERAQAWLAKCYIQQGWKYDAEDLIRNIQRDSINWHAQKEWDYTYADYYLTTGDYKKAIPYLKKVIRYEMRHKQKAREWYLLGQMYKELGQKALAYKAFKHVIRLNPPYQTAFNARVSMTEVITKSTTKQIVRKLRHMAASDNNAQYLDQIYYAIGNIYLAEKDTAKAISAYEKGNIGSTRNGIEKGVLLLKLGNLYWEIEKFSDARRCYGEAIGLLDKERKDYEQMNNRSKVLDELVPYTDAVHLQDSLQSLANMSEKDRNAAIDRTIKALKEKEKKAAKDSINQDGGMGMEISDFKQSNNNIRNTATKTSRAQQSNDAWYFYNPITVTQGKTAFEKLWGKRKNEDDWQRSNKTVVGEDRDKDETANNDSNDSIKSNKQQNDSTENGNDSNDPHKRGYYLNQIPFTEEQIQASNKILEDGLYNSGVIFKDKLDNLTLSEKALRRLTDKYHDYEHLDDAFYHLFLLYSRKKEPAIAEKYVDSLKTLYPKSQWTILLSDPYFKENSKFGVQIEDSLYASTYNAFIADRLNEVAGNVHISESRFPIGANRDKFIFIGGLGKLNEGDVTGCLNDMNTVVEKYPKSGVSGIAGMIINGVKAGRRLHGGHFDIGNIWQQRSYTLNDSDSLKTKTFSPERNTDFLFVMAYPTDSINENQLLYEWAKYNFTNFLVRNFDIEIVNEGALHRMQIGGFRNYDEAWQYAKALSFQSKIRNILGHYGRSIIISSNNIGLLGINFSYDDYDKFYNENFAPLKITQKPLLDEPTDIITIAPEKNSTDNNTQTSSDKDGNNEMIIPIVPQKDNTKTEENQNGIIIPTEPKKKEVSKDEQNKTVIPATSMENAEKKESDNSTVIPIEPEKKIEQKEEQETTIISTESEKKSEEKDDKQKPADNNNEIYFDDGTNTDKKVNDKKKKEDSTDIEDEYYDLNGF